MQEILETVLTIPSAKVLLFLQLSKNKCGIFAFHKAHNISHVAISLCGNFHICQKNHTILLPILIKKNVTLLLMFQFFLLLYLSIFQHQLGYNATILIFVFY